MATTNSTPFDYLCTAYHQANKAVKGHLDGYSRLIDSLVTNMADYWQCPESSIMYIDRITKEKTSLREAMYLEGGMWHFSIGIRLCRENNERSIAVSPSESRYLAQTLFLSLAVEGTPESFTAKLAQYDEVFEINKITEENDRKVFYRFIAEKIESHYKDIFQYITAKGILPEKLGQI